MVGDFSPTAALAGAGRVPHVRIGDRFTLPSAEAPAFPPFRRGGPVVPEARLREAVAEALRSRGRAAPAALPAAFRTEASLLCTLPEVDFAPTDAPDLARVGPLEPLPPPASGAPEVDWFAYLSASHPVTPVVLRALRGTGLAGAAYVRDAAPAFLERFACLGLALLPRPPALAEAAARARFVVHHGGLSTAQTCLALGRPQVLVPRHAEQALTARRLAACGAAMILSPEGLDEAQAERALLALREDPRVSALAAEIAGRPAHGLRRAAEACLAVL